MKEHRESELEKFRKEVIEEQECVKEKGGRENEIRSKMTLLMRTKPD